MKPRPEHAAAMQSLGHSLRHGGAVTTAVAPQLFPTPPAICARMAEFIHVGARVLEPSAGTGNIVEAIKGRAADIVAVEVNRLLCENLARRFVGQVPGLFEAHCADFLDCRPCDLGEPFDYVVMNPPFERGADIKHIYHASQFIKPGGELIAICADGPRQRERFQPVTDYWEDLPAGTFAGTQVRAALFTLQL